MHMNRKRITFLPSVFWLVILFSVIFSFISISKHNHFQTFAWDLSFFDELLWKASRGIEPRSSLGGLHLLGDHFQPVILLLAPLYFIWSDVRMLLGAHAIISAANVIPIYLLAKGVLKNNIIAICISISYLMFTGFQFAVFDGFHQSVFAPLFIGWLYYFLETRNNKFYWFSVAGLIATKEEFCLLIAFIGIVIILYYKRVKLGVATILIGLISFFLIIQVIIPYFQKGPYTHFGYGELGNTPIDVLRSTFADPLKTIKLFVFPTVKLQTLWSTYLAFGFLPFFSGWHLLAILEQFAVRFVDTVTIHRWTNLNHYAFPLSPLMSVALIYSIRDFWVRKISYVKIALYVLFWAGLQNIIYHGPINSLLKSSFYETQMWEYDARQLITQMPINSIISSQNSLLPHLSQRSKFFLLPEIGDSEYIAVDLSDGPNKYSPLSHAQTLDLIFALLKEKKYQLVWRKNDSMLLRKHF